MINFEIGKLYACPKNDILVYDSVRNVVHAWDCAKLEPVPMRALPGSGPSRVASWAQKLGCPIFYIPAGEPFMIANVADQDLLQIVFGAKVGWTAYKEYYEVKKVKSV